MIYIKLLHVSTPEFHPRGFYYNKGTPVQHANPGTDRPHLYSFFLVESLKLTLRFRNV